MRDHINHVLRLNNQSLWFVNLHFYGSGIEPVPVLEKADVILSLDSDFLGSEGNVSQTRAFSARRKVTGADAKMNRLYVVENRYTVTGGMASTRP